MAILSVEERTAMVDGFRRLLSEHGSEDHVRKAMATELGYDEGLWKKIADMGILGLIIDPDHDGIGAGPVELEAIMEESGRALLTAPLFSSAVLAAGLIGYSSDDAAKARLLPEIAAGTRIATVAFTGDKGTWTADGVDVSAATSGDGVTLNGTAAYVTAGTQADTLLVVARTDAGLATFEVDAKAPGVTITRQATLDETIRLARITFANAPATPIAGADEAAINRTLDLGRVALAGEQAGGAQQVFEISMDYIKTRIQFGRPVGGFQALKHMAVDVMLDVESAISAARRAADDMCEGADTTQVSVNLAAFASADGFHHAAQQAIQFHGGIGFTSSNAAHLYLRRARAGVQLFGNSNFHRERYLSLLEQAA
ncbi:MAG: acyl-CoA dehydrogenase family protein [Paracoccaceae bacterium]